MLQATKHIKLELFLGNFDCHIYINPDLYFMIIKHNKILIYTSAGYHKYHN